MNADRQEGAIHLKASRANGPWSSEQTFVLWAHWASGIGCSHRACVAAASGCASAPAGLPWALRSPGSGKALLIPVTSLLESSHNPRLKQQCHTGVQAVELDGAVLLPTCEYTHSTVPSRQRVPLQPDQTQVVSLSPASLGMDIPNPVQGCSRSGSTATPSHGPHHSDHCCTMWQVLAANLTSWSNSGVDFLLKHVH